MEGSRCGFVYKQTIIYAFWLRNTCYVNCNCGVDAVIAFSCVLSKVQKYILSYLEEALS
ncbi:hypothetical protein HMPREF1991_01028 [Hoylesella loescheii DSM 19665 = JCM 12249 = ATCC 15930]|uniref:Uncharacterized protein n=1 Tax=Hoylesella loescheii DSM 19665 = JCM 12249 = ATCC 15930 TaxID=1122985 RepID=A0A069QLG4_HOYLO|nr:hypothetical protein HMPREF1991_01028 [Hoylesella loescheii DSM 19665 = JCM 12249 = ATCC 15930]